MLVVNGDRYDNLTDYVMRGYEFFPVGAIFLTLKEKDEAEKNNYQGVYHFILTYSDGQVDYEFVVMDKILDEDGTEILVMSPVFLPDEEIFKYIDVHSNEEGYANFEIKYQKFKKLDYRTDEYELIDYDRLVEPIYTSDLFVTDEGINYKIEKEFNFETSFATYPLEYIDDTMLNQMENDDYLGIFRIHVVFNTGEITTEDYTIYDIDGEYLYFRAKKVPVRNSINTPNYLTSDTGNTLIICREIKKEYIPFIN